MLRVMNGPKTCPRWENARQERPYVIRKLSNHTLSISVETGIGEVKSETEQNGDLRRKRRRKAKESGGEKYTRGQIKVKKGI